MPSPSELQRRDEAANQPEIPESSPNCFVTGKPAELASRCTCSNCSWWRRKHEEKSPLHYTYRCGCSGQRHDGNLLAHCSYHGEPIARVLPLHGQHPLDRPRSTHVEAPVIPRPVPCQRCRELERAATYVPPTVEELDQYAGPWD